jgi:hypothetical protein
MQEDEEPDFSAEAESSSATTNPFYFPSETLGEGGGVT